MVIQVLTKIASLFLMLAVGAVARKRQIITDETLDNLCKIVLSVTLPFLLLYVLYQCDRETLISLWPAPFYSASIIFTGYVLSYLIASFLKLPLKKKGTFIFVSSFQNSGFFAIPLALVLFGEKGVLYVIIFNMGFNMLYWTFGVWMLQGTGNPLGIKSLKNIINLPAIALAVGVFLVLFSVKLPKVFVDTAHMLGNATIPLALIVVGAMLASKNLAKRSEIRDLSLITLCRIVLVPLIFLIVLLNINRLSPIMRSIMMLQACMPSAATAPLVAKRFGGDYSLAAGAVFYTTLLSIITIPIFMSLVQR